MSEDLNAYRNWRAPANVAARAVDAYRERHAPSAFSMSRIAATGVAVAALVVISVMLFQPLPESSIETRPAPAALSLSRLTAPARPEMTVPLVPQFEIPKLHQITVDFDIEMPEEVL